MSLYNYLAWEYTIIRNIIYISQQQYILSIVKTFRKYEINEFRTPMDERQHYSKSQMPKVGSAEARILEKLGMRIDLP